MEEREGGGSDGVAHRGGGALEGARRLRGMEAAIAAPIDDRKLRLQHGPEMGCDDRKLRLQHQRQSQNEMLRRALDRGEECFGAATTGRFYVFIACYLKITKYKPRPAFPAVVRALVHDALAPVEVEKVLNLATTLTNQATTSTN
jgi:hypothetical protein